ncbi:MAG: hypothetical protein EPN39_20395 [Chitinophagaceae bacterium]|jgi:hypothetical protein|nr:MAG: hypothetical protein EPN39_20395 [Chitinophagaceae bacterium]
MKHLCVILFAVISCCAFSCTKNDNNVKPDNQLTGKWKMTEIKYTGTSTVNYDGESFITQFSGSGKDMNLHISFSANPNTYNSNGDYTITLTMSVLGQEIQQDFTINGFMGSGTWTKDGTTLVVTDKETGKSQPATIMQLDDKTIKILWGGDLTPSNAYNMPVKVVVNGTYVFERE